MRAQLLDCIDTVRSGRMKKWQRAELIAQLLGTEVPGLDKLNDEETTALYEALCEKIAERRERERKLASWHGWFAWHPVYLDTGELVWFETIERRRIEDSPISI